ncbi:MAG: NAD-dependent epimerase/dehydratase family protein [Planctomycetota bacterium]
MSAISKTRVAVVGAGFISDVHLGSLRALGEIVETVGLCDMDGGRARAAQEKWGLKESFTDLDEMVAKVRPDAVHILTPPPTHAELSKRLLSQGIHVFLEKPMALSTAEADGILSTAAEGGGTLGVNHNATSFPAFSALLDDIAAHRLGRIQHVSVVLNLPLRQLIAGDFKHWMFAHPRNIVFESLYHPFSQVRALLGSVVSMESNPLGHRRLTRDLDFYDTWQLSMECERGTAQIFFSCAKDYAANRLVVLGQDAAADIDVFGNNYTRRGRTKYPEFFDTFLWNRRAASELRRSGRSTLLNYVFSTLKLKGRSDPFYLSTAHRVRAFYEALRLGGTVPEGGAEGKAVVRYCELAAAGVPEPRAVEAPPTPAERTGETLVIGGTGFMGRHLIRRLLDDGHDLRVMMRRPDLVPEFLSDPRIRVVAGDITDPESMLAAVCGARFVYHLAAAAPDSWNAAKRIIVEGTRNVAEACAKAGVERLFYTSTIATYYLGGTGPVREDTPIDPGFEKRSFYARAKAESEHLLEKMHAERGLNVLIFRPGVVVGRYGRPPHSAVGYWVNATNAVAWGIGDQPMPLVLVGDCADALARAAKMQDVTLRSFNLVGDVRLTPREYVKELAAATGREIRLHPLPIWRAYLIDLFKWVVKLATRRPNVVFPSYRDLATRVQRAQFDCAKTKEVLGWSPVADRATFIQEGIAYDGDDPKPDGAAASTPPAETAVASDA